MARHGEITLVWADGEYCFRLGWRELIAVQEACDAGPAYILDRLAGRDWRMEHVEKVLFHGLMGGGTEIGEVRRLIKTFVHECGLLENVLIAQAVLWAALEGAPDEVLDDMPGKPDAGTTTPPFPAES